MCNCLSDVLPESQVKHVAVPLPLRIDLPMLLSIHCPIPTFIPYPPTG